MQNKLLPCSFLTVCQCATAGGCCGISEGWVVKRTGAGHWAHALRVDAPSISASCYASDPYGVEPRKEHVLHRVEWQLLLPAVVHPMWFNVPWRSGGESPRE